ARCPCRAGRYPATDCYAPSPCGGPCWLGLPPARWPAGASYGGGLRPPCPLVRGWRELTRPGQLAAPPGGAPWGVKGPRKAYPGRGRGLPLARPGRSVSARVGATVLSPAVSAGPLDRKSFADGARRGPSPDEPCPVPAGRRRHCWRRAATATTRRQ